MYKPMSMTPEQAAIAEKNDLILDKMISALQLKNDAALSRAMKSAPPVISKMRHGKLPFGAAYIIIAHELTGMPVREIKELLGEPSLAQIIVD